VEGQYPAVQAPHGVVLLTQLQAVRVSLGTLSLAVMALLHRSHPTLQGLRLTCLLWHV
jgi:hypothetical protein